MALNMCEKCFFSRYATKEGRGAKERKEVRAMAMMSHSLQATGGDLFSERGVRVTRGG